MLLSLIYGAALKQHEAEAFMAASKALLVIKRSREVLGLLQNLPGAL